MLQRGSKTSRQLAVGHKDHSNHQQPAGLTPALNTAGRRIRRHEARHICALRRIIQAK
jgi:hypothetical protein